MAIKLGGDPRTPATAIGIGVATITAMMIVAGMVNVVLDDNPPGTIKSALQKGPDT